MSAPPLANQRNCPRGADPLGCTDRFLDRVAQSVEQETFNLQVAGSIPAPVIVAPHSRRHLSHCPCRRCNQAIRLAVNPSGDVAVEGAFQAPSRQVRAVRRSGDITLDGRLDESAGSAAQRSGGFVQAYPAPGKPSPDSTEFRVLYDDAAIYVGVRLFDAHPDGTGPAAAFVVPNPDFNVRSLRGNAVMRWDYRPGSSLYAVWQQSRSDYAPIGDFSTRRDVGAIFDALPTNVFLLKATYWMGR